MEPSQPPQERDVEHTPAPRERGVGTECPHFVFIVTSYGCNSTPSDMWVPHSKIFTKYDEAYAYFLKMSPPLDDEDNRVEQVIHNIYKEDTYKDDRTKEYVIIENRVELAGYHCGDGHYAKRPKGAVIARSMIQ
jgi:hypothetical protein